MGGACIVSQSSSNSLSIFSRSFHAGTSTLGQDLLNVLSSAMNSLVVAMCKDGAAAELSTHMSDAALQAFTHLHHL
jgi:hypothetical protein